MILVSPAEPPTLRALGRTSPLPESRGADFLLPAHESVLALQRKTFPDDLLSSLEDGRLEREMSQLKRSPIRTLLLEGRPMWTGDGLLLSRRRYTRAQVWGVIFSIMFEFGTPILWTASLDETAGVVSAAESWFRKGAHRSLYRRPTAASSTGWGKATDRDWARHFLQGFPGVGSVLAEAIFDRFGRVPLGWEVSYQELSSVDGIGPKRARSLWTALERGESARGTA